jgi:hypothetical protein
MVGVGDIVGVGVIEGFGVVLTTVRDTGLFVGKGVAVG